jgi:hypothetical protein
MLNIDKNIFATNLRLTQQYCDIQKTHTEKNSTSIFRSFNPQINRDYIFKFKLSDYGLEENVKFSFLTDWSIDPTERENEYLISELFEKQLSHKKASVTNIYTNIIFSGDILVAQVYNTVIDGASAVVSSGLIDDYDCPPIDTWFYQTTSTRGRLLFAWIPHEFVSLANDAVLVNCVDCINWFKNWYPKEYEQMTDYLKQHTTT